MKNITIDGVEYALVIKQVNKRITQLLDFEVVYHLLILTIKTKCKQLNALWDARVIQMCYKKLMDIRP